MSELNPLTPEVLDAEVVDPPTQIAVRNFQADGKFAPGNQVARARGPNKITRAMRAEGLEDMIARGFNPIKEATRRVLDPNLPPRFQMDALALLFRTFFGEKTVFEIETSEPADEERIQRTRKMLAALWISEDSPK